ncbi:MAG: PAS domain S-box protein [Planctomycetota bacterium]
MTADVTPTAPDPGAAPATPAGSALTGEQLLAVFKGNPIPTFVWRHDNGAFYLVDYNAAAEAFTHGAVRRFVGQRADVMFGDLPEILAGLARCVSSGTHAHEMEYPFRTTNRTSWLHCNYAPVPPDLVAVATLDITERVLAERALRDSRERYRRLYDNAMVGLGRSRVEDGRLVECNLQLAQMLGYSDAEEVLREGGMVPYANLDDKRRLRELLADNGLIHDFEARYIRRDGSEAWVRSTLRLDDDGTTIEGVALDVTEWKRAEERLRLLATVVEVAAEAIIIADPTRHIEYANPAFTTLTGWTAAEVIGLESTQLLDSGRNEAALSEQIHTIIDRGQQYRGRLSGRRKDGTVFEADVSIRPMKNAAGEVVRHIAVLRDATHESRLERQLEQARKMEAIGRLAGGVAHDFNNLLTAIIGHTQLSLGRVQEGDPVHEDLVAVRDAGERAARLTRQLLEFSRPQPLRLVAIDLNDVLRGMERMIDDMASIAPMSINTRFSLCESPAMVLGDRAQIERVVMNLVVNSIDAMPGGGTISISTALRQITQSTVTALGELPTGAWVTFDVADTGTGMSPEVAVQMFEPFFTTKPPGRGTGLGLATVHGVMRQLGGGVSVDSTPGGGTAVRVWLPRANPADPRAQHSRRRDLTAHYGGSERVWLVEDDPAVRRLVALSLEQQGYRLEIAETAELALQAMESATEAPDVMITDLRLPGLNGRDLTQRIRARWPDLRVVFISGHPDRYLADGTSDTLPANTRLLQKPFSPVDLLQELRRLLDSDEAS